MVFYVVMLCGFVVVLCFASCIDYIFCVWLVLRVLACRVRSTLLCSQEANQGAEEGDEKGQKEQEEKGQELQQRGRCSSRAATSRGNCTTTVLSGGHCLGS